MDGDEGGEDEADEDAEGIQDDDIASEVDDGDEGEAEDAFPTSTGNPSLDELHALLNEHGLDKVFPPLDGTAFYTNICKINHSCVPNVIVTYTTRFHLKPTPILGLGTHEASVVRGDDDRNDGLVALVKVLRPIQPGEELVQSYIDTNLGTISPLSTIQYSLSSPYAIVYTDYTDRQAALQDYGFVCTCSKCIEEVAAMQE